MIWTGFFQMSDGAYLPLVLNLENTAESVQYNLQFAVHIENGEKRMLWKVSKPTYF